MPWPRHEWPARDQFRRALIEADDQVVAYFVMGLVDDDLKTFAAPELIGLLESSRARQRARRDSLVLAAKTEEYAHWRDRSGLLSIAHHRFAACGNGVGSELNHALPQLQRRLELTVAARMVACQVKPARFAWLDLLETCNNARPRREPIRM